MPLTPFDLRCESFVDPLGVETPSPRLSWKLRGDRGGQRQTAYRIQVASAPEKLGTDDLWDSDFVESGESVLVPYGGSELESFQRCYWRVQAWDGDGEPGEWSEVRFWEMALLHRRDWKAQWIGRASARSPLLRKAFSLKEKPVQATLFVSTLGYGECYFNGQKLGDRVLSPTVSRYDVSAPYLALDAADLLQEGENVAGAMLGNGWYNPLTKEVWWFEHAPWQDHPKLLWQLQVEYAEGETETFVSDGSWKISDGPITFDQLRNGETYDAREERPGWNATGYDDGSWAQAEIVAAPGGALYSQLAPPCRVTQTLRPKEIREIEPGVFVLDLGQNIAGWLRLTVSGPAGTEVTMRYAEKLRENGDIDQSNIDCFIKDGDCQTDRYILKGEGVEVFEPHFTYHGYRYARITGFPGVPTVDQFEGRVVGSDFESAGKFECSNELLNRIQECTLWSYRSNFVGIPTDCPHREKNGWTGDAMLAVDMGLLNFASAAGYAKWLADIEDAQRPSGQLPGIVPTGGWGYKWGSGPAWDSALILIPWAIYQHCGDKEILERHFDAMTWYVDYMTTMATDNLVSFGLGDWCPVDESHKPSTWLTSSGYYYVDCQVVSEIATMLGRPKAAEKYGALAEAIREAINAKLYDSATGRYDNGGQTAQGCALYQGLAPEEERPKVLARLVEAIEEHDGHLDFGILGAKYVFRALSDGGRADVAYALATKTTFPSYGQWLERGATTLWEDWNGENSLNHIMFGDISAWMFETLAGLYSLEPGYRRFAVSPYYAEELEWVRAEHECPYGTIRVSWDASTLNVEVPVGCIAEVTTPSGETEEAVAGTHRWERK